MLFQDQYHRWWPTRRGKKPRHRVIRRGRLLRFAIALLLQAAVGWDRGERAVRPESATSCWRTAARIERGASYAMAAIKSISKPTRSAPLQLRPCVPPLTRSMRASGRQQLSQQPPPAVTAPPPQHIDSLVLTRSSVKEVRPRCFYSVFTGESTTVYLVDPFAHPEKSTTVHHSPPTVHQSTSPPGSLLSTTVYLVDCGGQ